MFRLRRNTGLGPLEVTILEILWEQGESSVHTVAPRLDRPLAYTTVMTTLDRLYKKGLLDRRKADRAFLYVPRFTRGELERKRADDLVAGFLDGPEPGGELLISCLVDAVSQQDAALLDDLEKKIRMKRMELQKETKS